MDIESASLSSEIPNSLTETGDDARAFFCEISEKLQFCEATDEDELQCVIRQICAYYEKTEWETTVIDLGNACFWRALHAASAKKIFAVSRALVKIASQLSPASNDTAMKLLLPFFGQLAPFDDSIVSKALRPVSANLKELYNAGDKAFKLRMTAFAETKLPDHALLALGLGFAKRPQTSPKRRRNAQLAITSREQIGSLHSFSAGRSSFIPKSGNALPETLGESQCTRLFGVIELGEDELLGGETRACRALF